MDGSTLWFVGLALLAVVMLLIGRGLGRVSFRSSIVVLVVALVGISIWSWLQRNPAIAAQIIPVGSLQYLEGTASVPVFMLILGIGWARARSDRERGLVAAGAVVGLLLFLQGGLWMIQSTPGEEAFPNTPGRAHVVLQSQDYSCVPAASATALNLIGFRTTEAMMAQYTHTRPMTGATAIRAAEGLQRRLQGTGVNVRLVQADVDQLATLPAPMLLTVNFDRSRSNNHMVVLMYTTPEGAQVADPQDGMFFIPWSALKQSIAGPAIVFERTPQTQYTLADAPTMVN